MSNMNIPVGISDFKRIREENYYYIDKSGLISTFSAWMICSRMIIYILRRTISGVSFI